MAFCGKENGYFAACLEDAAHFLFSKYME